MAIMARPNITPYGASFGEYGGDKLTNYTPSGGINPEALGSTLMNEAVQFNNFEKTIHDYVMARLGHPMVRVELTPFQIKTAIDEATTYMYTHCPMWTKQFAVFDASAGINLYEIPQYILDNLEYVVYKKSLLTIQAQAGTLRS